MENSVCLDNNIIVRFLAPDEQSDTVLRLFRRIAERDMAIFAPALLNFELVSVLQKKRRLKLLTDGDVQEMTRTFFTLPILLTWNESLIAKSLELTDQGAASPYDAAYLAVAMLKDVALVTSDLDFRKRAKKVYRKVYTPEEWLEA